MSAPPAILEAPLYWGSDCPIEPGDWVSYTDGPRGIHDWGQVLEVQLGLITIEWVERPGRSSMPNGPWTGSLEVHATSTSAFRTYEAAKEAE
jgi:hypothetical protein